MSWSAIFLVTLLLMSSKPVTSSHNVQVARPSKVVIRQNRLADSLKIWRKLRALHQNTYRRTVERGFLTFYDITAIIVRRGKVVSRVYSYFERNSEDAWVVMDSWKEEGEAVGKHRKSGVAPNTIDELYKVCRDEVLALNPRVNIIYLGFKANGVLDICAYGLRGYTNDVSPGVYVGTLEFLPTKPD